MGLLLFLMRWLAAIYLIMHAWHTPRDFVEDKHAPLLLHIRSLLFTRARRNHSAHIQKVVSHIGITDNEMADLGATQALSSDEHMTTASYP